MECETAVRDVLPAVRSLLAEELSKDMTQEQIADALDLTQPAVSRYLKQSRGILARELMKKKGVKELIKRTAESIRKGRKVEFC
ncbi:ArsR family transcriptional regulator, partial [Candidatus Micrarchaeota archaeon]|nr:ArsR family transcriptional regulator [Candidatus Micrarchaeota archaeon]